MGKVLYQVICLLAIANLVAIVGVVAFLYGTGRLDGERLEQIAAVLRGEDLAEAAATTPAATQPATQPLEKGTAETRLARAREEGDLAQRLLERRGRELEDRQQLADAMMLDIIRRQETLAEEQAALDEQQRKIREERLRSGFVKELELLAAVKPKVRKDLLAQKSDADVVRLMMEMDERAGKQVIEVCKTPEEKAWMARILHRIQTQKEPSSAEAEVEEQEAQ